MDVQTPPLDAGSRLTLCIATRDRPELVERYLLPCLRRLGRGSRAVVVDQSSDRRTAALLEPLEQVSYLHLSRPGLSHARNVAVAATCAPLLAFTDDDVTFDASWPAAISRTLEAVPEAGAVCGRAVRPDGTLLPGSPAAIYRWPTSPFSLGSGFNIAFRREALLDAGPFDEALGAGARFRSAEDSDMLYRVMRAGWSVVCSDEVTVTHHDWRGRREELRLHYGYGLGAGAQTAKHVAAGDGTAGAIARREVRLHLATVVRSLLLLRPWSAILQAPYLAGMLAGYRGYRDGGGPSARPSESRR